MEDLVSIIMPAYNAETYIEASIVSVIDQTHKNWELLVIDDGSTDTTAFIVKKYTDVDSRLKLLSQQNKRLGAARNAGLKVAVGEWIAFLDADDLWEPTKLEKQLQKSKELTDIDVIFSSGWQFNDNNLGNLTHYRILTGRICAEHMYRYEYANNYIPVMSVLVKKAMVDKVGLQEEDSNFYGCEDWDYWVRMALAGAIFYGMEEQLFYYRRHCNNMSANTLKMKLAQLAVFLKNYESAILNYDETNTAFVPLVNSLIIELVKTGKKRQVKEMLRALRSVIPGKVLYYQLLLGLTDKHTIKFFELANRAYIGIKRRLNKNYDQAVGKNN